MTHFPKPIQPTGTIVFGHEHTSEKDFDNIGIPTAEQLESCEVTFVPLLKGSDKEKKAQMELLRKQYTVIPVTFEKIEEAAVADTNKKLGRQKLGTSVFAGVYACLTGMYGVILNLIQDDIAKLASVKVTAGRFPNVPAAVLDSTARSTLGIAKGLAVFSMAVSVISLTVLIVDLFCLHRKGKKLSEITTPGQGGKTEAYMLVKKPGDFPLHKKIVKSVVDPDVKAKDLGYDKSHISAAFKRHESTLVRKEMEKMGDMAAASGDVINKTDSKGSTLLFRAIRANDKESVVALLSNPHVDINFVCEGHLTPLELALQNENDEISLLLIQDKRLSSESRTKALMEILKMPKRSDATNIFLANKLGGAFPIS